MRAGIVIGQVNRIGGMEKQGILLAGRLRKRGIDTVLLIGGVRRKKVSSAVDLAGIETRYLYRKRWTEIISKRLLRHYCRKNRISHLIAFHFSNAEICTAAETGCRMIFNVRSVKFSVFDELAARYRRVAASSDYVVTNSRNTASLLVDKGVAAPDHVAVIHNAVELPHTKPSFNRNTILYVGSIKQVKDPLTFLEGCRYVIEREREVSVVMAGEGPMRPDVEEYINEHGLQDNFTLTGEIPFAEIPFKDASVFVNSSLRESNSNSVLEALSFGVPVVATDNPGNRDIVSGLEGHEIVPAGDSIKMGRAIIRALNLSKSERLEIFDKSRKFISDHYDVSRVTEQYINLMKSI